MNTLLVRAAAASLSLPLVLTAVESEAHAHLVGATPAANSAGNAPGVLRLDFSERLEPKFSGVMIMMGSGKTVPAISKAAGMAVNVTPKRAFLPGGYMVMWHVVSADGHKMKGQYNFTVR